MNRNIFLVSVVILAIVSLFVFTTTHTKKQDTVEVGAILPLTGDNAVYGKALQRGMELALTEISERWSHSGKLLQIHYEDSKAKPQSGVSAMKKLVEVNKVPIVIGGMFSSVSLAIAPIAQRERVIQLSPTSSSVDLTTSGPWFFRIYPSDTYDGIFLADFAFKTLRAKKAAVL